MFNESRCYRPDEIAVILGIDKSTVYRLIKDLDDPLPAYRPTGTHLRVNGGDLNKWLERRRVKPDDE